MSSWQKMHRKRANEWLPHVPISKGCVMPAALLKRRWQSAYQKAAAKAAAKKGRLRDKPMSTLLGYWPCRWYRSEGFGHAVSLYEEADLHPNRSPFFVQWFFALTPSGHTGRRFKSRVCAEAFALACDDAVAAGGRPEDVPARSFRRGRPRFVSAFVRMVMRCVGGFRPRPFT